MASCPLMLMSVSARTSGSKVPSTQGSAEMRDAEAIRPTIVKTVGKCGKHLLDEIMR